MEAGDVLTILLVLTGIWYLAVPERIRERAGPVLGRSLGDAVHGAAGAVRAVCGAVAPLVRWLAYDVIVGRKPAALSTVSDAAPADVRPVMSRLDLGTTPVPVPGTADLDDRALVEWLAGLKTSDNRDRFSANAIYELVGGRRGDVLQWVKDVRTGQPQVVIDRVHQPDRYHQDAPALRYQGPPLAE